ncbi:uncharacterized protein LOC124374004 [Homalodisca vitripennis]|uniref:uncharacterized protein LOC124374004 n=1 Tax=Homalodisca vitripennis TaxID=197043 RepID=UPI001EEB9024|nr:uncharacterized protein LOC124374004 [Homalodisca vitripennis]
MVREVESGDYLSTDHMDRFGSILDENTEYHPVSCLAIDAMEGVSAVATPHIQILFSGKIDASSIGHWIVVFHDGSNLYVYDSLNSAHLTADQTKLLSLLFPDLSIVPAFIPVQRQENGFDCGVFAIANATSLALGRDPAKLRYDIPSMRPHLAEMLRTGRLDMFPTLSVSSPPEPIIKDPNSTCLSIVESLPPLEISTMSVCAPVKKGPGMLFIVTLSSTLKSTEMLFNVTLSSTLRSTEMLSSVTLSSTLRSTEMLFSVTLSNILRSIEMLFSATLSSILKFTGVLFSVIQKNILTQIYKKLFDEEKDRKKWCCGEGSYKVHNLPPLDASFYSNRLFIERARAYNDLFAFCALEVTGGYRHPSGLAFFKIEGKMYHQVHSLDAPGQKFRTKGGDVQFVNRCRLYIDDGEERKNIAMGRSLNSEVIDEINTYLLSCNPFINDFRRLSDEPSVNAHLEFEVTSRSTHGPVLGDRQTGIEVHAVLSNEDTITDPRKLTIWKKSDRRPSSVDLFSPLMEPFQYPLLYPQGNLGWHIGRLDNHGGKLSQYNYSRCLLLSDPRFSHFGRLSQAWQVEMFARYEEERLRFIRFSQTRSAAQNSLRIGPLDELLEAQRGRQAGGQVLGDITRDETVLGEGGVQAGKVYLPSSFTGGPRYMKVHYENAMGLVSRLGSPTFFLTFTFSATWEENKKACPHNSGRSDPSTACRIFQIKLGELLRDLRSGAMFSRPARDIDSVIRADIPSEEEAAGRLRKLVLKHMIHGPCGTDHRTDFLCWDSAKGHCNKFYPKPACQTTHVDERGFVQYKRDYTNEGFITSRRRQIKVHDGWVVPYNSALLLKYEAHINLELASTRRVIKYLFKYLMKGGSLQNVTVTPLGKQEDEVEHYVTKRMVGASDACWRLLDFPVSKLEPTVECLPVHLEGKQSVVFRPRQLSDAVTQASSKLMVYFNRPHHETFDNVTYQTFYEKFMVHTKRPRTAELYEHPDGHHFVTTRQRGEKVCRLMWVSPNRGEQYYLRILLMSTPCRGYVDLLARGGPGCRTFQDVARNLGLVEDEEEYNHALREASTFMTGPRLRSFFVILCNMGAPAALLWESFKNHLSEDHLERNPLDPELAVKLTLIDIDRSLRQQGSCLKDHGLPYVEDDTTELGRELLNYGENLQRTIVEDWVPKLSPDQRRVFEYVRSLLLNPRDRRTSRIIFLDGPGGYGKTSLIRVILAYVRGCRQVALAVASSGIAARNMAGGTTAHSMFRLPLDLGHGTGVWNITNGSQRAELIRAAQLIVFDEAPMAHRYIFEMIDRSLRDLMNSSVPFGNKIFICSGDFRQIAPVVEKARTPADVACVSLRASHLWRLFTLFSLTTPQRTSGSIDYSNFLLGVGNGTINPLLFGEGRERESLIPLTGVRCLTSLADLITDVFPPGVLRDPDLCARRAILSTLNVNVKEINGRILDLMDGRIHELRSADTVDREDDDGLDVDVNLLNQATGKGVVPDHVLRLKVGSVCLIMRNLNIGDGLVNGTKVIVTAISSRLITVRLIGNTQPIGIPRITFRFAFAEGSPLRVCRRQFPLMLAYCMTGHKSQGQTIEYVGVDLRTDCFTHGQLYVLLSRVRRPDDIVVLVPDDRIVEGVAYAKNIVYDELLLNTD